MNNKLVYGNPTKNMFGTICVHFWLSEESKTAEDESYGYISVNPTFCGIKFHAHKSPSSTFETVEIAKLYLSKKFK